MKAGEHRRLCNAITDWQLMWMATHRNRRLNRLREARPKRTVGSAAIVVNDEWQVAETASRWSLFLETWSCVLHFRSFFANPGAGGRSNGGLRESVCLLCSTTPGGLVDKLVYAVSA